MTPPPTPFHLLRIHASPLTSLSFSPTNTILYSADQTGHISILDLRTRRLVCYWQAHGDGVLGVEEWEGRLISHGRDNLIHLYHPYKPIHGVKDEHPKADRSLDVNALNFCRFSLAPLLGNGKGKAKEKEAEALLAVPNLIDSGLADIYHLPSMRRLHSSVNASLATSSTSRPAKVDPKGARSGLIMSLHLRFLDSRLALAMGLEDGRVELWTCALKDGWEGSWDSRLSEERRWKKVSEGKGHNEAVMAMAVDRDMSRAFTVSADHLLCRYDFARILTSEATKSLTRNEVVSSCSVKQIGNASVAISSDGRIVAVGGWDGKIRLFSTATFKPLGTLAYHRDSVQALAFAQPPIPGGDDAESVAETLELGAEDSEEEDGVELDGVPPRERWLASGGKDRRVALWGLMDFAGNKREG